MGRRTFTCYKCRVKADDVAMRQCDYHLCNQCELKRLAEMKEIEKSRKSSAPSKSSPAEIKKLVSSLQTKPKPKANQPPAKQQKASPTVNKQPSTLEKLFSTPTKLLNSGFAAATSLLIDYPNSSDSIEEAEHDKLLDFVKCVHTDCNIISPIEPTYSCSVCSRSLHLQCAGLTKPPIRKWTCADCKDLHSLAKNLQKTVTSLQQEMGALKSKHSELVRTQQTLQSENAELKSQQADLRTKQDELQIENLLLRQEVDHLKENHPNDSEQSHQGRVNCKPDNHHSQSAFVIGDSMLRDFNSKNFINTQFKSISGATVSNVFDHLNSRKDLHIYKDIVIHAGTNDVAKNIALDETLLAMEASITWLMRKAPTARVHISAVCPRTKDQLQHKIDTLNAAFKDLATRLDCNFIESGQQMVYQNGRVDWTQHSFQMACISVSTD